MEPIRDYFILLGVLGLLALCTLSAGCDQLKAAKDRVAVLACASHGGSKSYMPKGDHLEVMCKDGTLVSVKWLPSK